MLFLLPCRMPWMPLKKRSIKQIKLLEHNRRHPYLRAKKYDETRGRWQARVKQGLALLFHYTREHIQNPQSYSAPQEIVSRIPC